MICFSILMWCISRPVSYEDRYKVPEKAVIAAAFLLPEITLTILFFFA